EDGIRDFHVTGVQTCALPISKQLLFVAESYKNRILKIDLKKNKASPEYISVFHALPFNKENPETGNLPDGLALDENERLWVAHRSEERRVGKDCRGLVWRYVE